MRVGVIDREKYYYAIVTEHDLWAVFDDEQEANEWNASFEGVDAVGEVRYMKGDAIKKFVGEITTARLVADGYV